MARSIPLPSAFFVDVGGTHTRLFVRGPFGQEKIIGAFKTDFKTLLADLKKALRKTKTHGPLMIGLRGVWTPQEKKFWQKELRSLGRSLTILSDVELAHHMAFDGKSGILLNAGTGSIAIGRDKKGKFLRAGGLGPLFGDEGSGFWIGREYIKSKIKKDGHTPKWRGYLKNPSLIPEVAGYAAHVLKTGLRKPQSVEGRIIQDAQEHLLALVEELYAELKDGGKVSVHLWGGLFQNVPFRNQFAKRLLSSNLKIKLLD